MDTARTVFATLLVLAVLALLGWLAVWGFGYVSGVLAPIDSATMALVVAGWIGLWGAGLLIAFGLRGAFSSAERSEQLERRADAYAFLLDALANARLVDPLPEDASEAIREGAADVRAALRQAERRLALHGSSSVIEAYRRCREETGAGSDAGDAHGALLSAMRRDLGHSSYGIDADELLPVLGADAAGDRGERGDRRRRAVQIPRT